MIYIYIYLYTSLLYKKYFSSIEMNTEVHLIWQQDRIDMNINWSNSDIFPLNIAAQEAWHQRSFKYLTTKAI